MALDIQNLEKHMHTMPAIETAEASSQKPGEGWIKRILFFVILLIILVPATAAASFWWLLQPPERNVNSEKEFIIAEGESIYTIAAHLEEDGLIRNRLAFRVLLVVQARETQVKAGAFMLSPSMSAFRISEVLTALAPPEQDISLTIPEGFTIDDIAIRIEKEGFSFEDFAAAPIAGDVCQAHDSLPPCMNSGTLSVRDFEGYLFPDTYRLRKDAAPSDIVEKMLENFDKKLSPKLRAEMVAQGKTLHEIIIMASVIEKEVRTDADMKLVSGVLWKRIEIGMALQVDASVLYALRLADVEGKQTSADLTLQDLQYDSPYNTYRYPGLPAGPIANPGLAAIVAALRPEGSSYLYYLSAPDGTTIFSRTLEEHNRAKSRYLR